MVNNGFGHFGHFDPRNSGCFKNFDKTAKFSHILDKTAKFSHILDKTDKFVKNVALLRIKTDVLTKNKHCFSMNFRVLFPVYSGLNHEIPGFVINLR